MDEPEIDPFTAGGAASDGRSWPAPRIPPAWWNSAADRDRQADQADEAARARDQDAADRDATAVRRDDAATDREREATSWMMAAHQRLIDADIADARLWAMALAGVDAARGEHAKDGTEASRLGLVEAEAASEAQTVPLIRSSLERRSVRDDLDHAAQHLAAAAADRRAAAADRARSQLDRHAAADDRAIALAHRLQASIDRSGERP